MFLLLIAAANRVNAQKGLMVIIIRHAEKPADGDNLSCAGFNRSIQLASVIKSKFGIPNYLFAPAIKNSTEVKRSRSFQTLLPLSVKYNLKINTSYDVDDTKSLAENILKKKGVVLICWEHNKIQDLLALLGVSAKHMVWKGDDYDSILKLNFSGRQVMLTPDKQNIIPSGNCKF